MKYKPVEDMLNKKLRALEERLTKVKRNVSKSHSSDSSEQAQERENDEVLEEIGRETSLAIQEIRSALEKIDNKTVWEMFELWRSYKSDSAESNSGNHSLCVMC